MTVSYTGDVANSSTFGCFNKIMGKWRGSVYKLVYKELLAYISCYFVINMTYRMIIVPKSECNLAFDGDTCMRWKTHRELFEQVDFKVPGKMDSKVKTDPQMRLYISVNLKQYPLTFVLGFYVSPNMIIMINQSQNYEKGSRFGKQIKMFPFLLLTMVFR